jgi:hypothetical protein
VDIFLPPCFLAWVKSLPENEKETLRKLRAETVRRHKEGLIPVDNNGKRAFNPSQKTRW